jgi:nucleoid-associated protein YgaU
MFFKGSRYEKVPTREITDATGRTIRYKATRFISETRALEGHRVVAGERLDHIAFRHLRDAERFWRIADANRALWPDDLLELAAILRIPPSEE